MKSTAYHCDLNVWVGEAEGTATLLQKLNIDKLSSSRADQYLLRNNSSLPVYYCSYDLKPSALKFNNWLSLLGPVFC